MSKISLSLLCLICFSNLIQAQKSKTYSASEIYQEVEKINVLASALYIAAHPDDENTRLITYLSNEVKAETAYLSLTRGNGGQNLISNELGNVLGVIRTQELLNARKIDGGVQYFSSANDFGFSKLPKEAYDKWNKNQITEEMIYLVRKLQPDIIINRFDHRTEGNTHGHHTASAQLSEQIFEKANDKNVFPDQLKELSLWQPKRLFFNASWWFFGGKEQFKKADKSSYIPLQTGFYYPNLGRSNQEIAALSRSQHQSQGFGDMSARGEDIEYLELIKGPKLQNQQNLFEGIDITWKRIKNGEPIGKKVSQLLSNFNFKDPSKNIDALVEIYKMINALDNSMWKTQKMAEVQKCIALCAGLFLEVSTEDQIITPGFDAVFKYEVINRSKYPMEIKEISILNNSFKKEMHTPLLPNQLLLYYFTTKIPSTIPYSNAEWLIDAKKSFYNQFDGHNELSASFQIKVKDIILSYNYPLVYKYKDEVKGEIYDNVLVLPDVSLRFEKEIYLSRNNDEIEITALLKSFRKNIKGTLELVYENAADGKIKSIPVHIPEALKTERVSFKIKPSEQNPETPLKLIFRTDTNTFTEEVTLVAHNHIPTQVILSQAKTVVKNIKVATKGKKVGYIMGAGDKIPEGLANLGYEVTLLNISEITAKNLAGYDAVLLGIRAFNTLNELKFKNRELFEYAESGGNVIVQYNTNHSLVTDQIAPYKLILSKDRITDEDAEIHFLKPDHKVLHYPNEISKEDFKGWIQEQGLYYANDFDRNHFVPLFESHDFDEPSTNGGLLIAKYGKGYYTYTGLSLFRQIPEGVPGAYKILANLIALNKDEK